MEFEERVEKFLKETKESPQNLTARQMLNIVKNVMTYKALGYKTPVPEWVYLEALSALTAAYDE